MEEEKKSRQLNPPSIFNISLSMEENSTKINAIPTEQPLHSPMASHPLMSTVVTLYTLILLYFPTTIAFSPVLISTSLLLLSLLKLGAAQRAKKPESKDPSLQVSRDFAYHDDCTSCEKDWVFDPEPKPDLDPDPIRFHDNCFVESNVGSNCEKDSVFDPEPKPDRDSDCFVECTTDAVCGKDSVYDPEPRPFCGDSFVEWNVRAPLEVIYEAYEGEEEECTEEKREEELRIIQRYASLSMYYPETDTDSSSDGDSPVIGNWDSPEKSCFRWDEEEDREELIEIELDFCKRNSEVEEENLIEIDLTPANLPLGLFCN
ncbi:PREDICTED: uncharacterized protein LOC109244744 [Nicotiana attenuata]|uniref:Uncharacterized protein n=1 Tax=Nicotiana attenuata TaxID=49451 RepID=A0A1J6J736_NICAT|nr:PREDICTED: uncharacterized protein LOC109244744 [Nicotiana attenuata]OIT05655.1 hypothetical protein A4A49_27091 [Nicotiana attenuata]